MHDMPSRFGRVTDEDPSTVPTNRNAPAVLLKKPLHQTARAEGEHDFSSHESCVQYRSPPPPIIWMLIADKTTNIQLRVPACLLARTRVGL